MVEITKDSLTIKKNLPLDRKKRVEMRIWAKEITSDRMSVLLRKLVGRQFFAWMRSMPFFGKNASSL